MSIYNNIYRFIYDATNREPQLLYKYHHVQSKATHSHDEIDDKLDAQENQVNEEIRKIMPSFLKSIYICTLVMYFALIYLNIIDISANTKGEASSNY